MQSVEETAMSKRSAVHATFVIEQTYDVPPAKVSSAFANQTEKDRWFEGPPDWEKGPRQFDFRVGGRETSSGGPKGGPVHSFNAIYHDIVPNERIVYSYDMHLGDKRISVSLTTIELKPAGSGTHVTFTEQGVFLDGHDDANSREQGTRWLLGQLGEVLQRRSAA
jgi:uncharacterized protein YndB with AHSA1/START domain